MNKHYNIDKKTIENFYRKNQKKLGSTIFSNSVKSQAFLYHVEHLCSENIHIYKDSRVERKVLWIENAKNNKDAYQLFDIIKLEDIEPKSVREAISNIVEAKEFYKSKEIKK